MGLPILKNTPPHPCPSHPILLQPNSQEVPIVKLCVLGSGSSGNAIFVSTGRTRILIDAGLSLRELTRRLADIGESPEKLDAVLISHEHTDHISGLPVLGRRHKIPVYLSSSTAALVDWGGDPPPVELFQAGTRFPVGDIDVFTFSVPHDAADPVAFCLRAEGIQLSLVTDLGYIPESVKYHVQGSDLLLLESNHDLEMLKLGPYPWPVKQRIMSRNGHLSNDVVSDFIRQDLDPRTSTLILAHISENNNHPELVRMVASQALAERALPTRLVVAEPHIPTEVIEL